MHTRLQFSLLLLAFSSATGAAQTRDPQVVENAARQFAVEADTDRSENTITMRTRLVETDPRQHGVCTTAGGAGVTLIAGRYAESGTVRYFLTVAYLGHEWIASDKNLPLKLVIDGSTASLPLLATPSGEVIERGAVTEVAAAAVPATFFGLLGRAHAVSLRFDGHKGYCELALAPETLEVARLFDARVVNSVPATAAQ